MQTTFVMYMPVKGRNIFAIFIAEKSHMYTFHIVFITASFNYLQHHVFAYNVSTVAVQLYAQ